MARLRLLVVAAVLALIGALLVLPASAAVETLFGSTTPPVKADPDPGPLTVGLKFVPNVDGRVTGIRFYKGTGNTGTHVVGLYTSAGTKIAGASSTSTATGWISVSFAGVDVTAGATYTAAVLDPHGHFSRQAAYPWPKQGTNLTGLLGVYRYGSTLAFPSSSSGSNYWVDVNFSATASPTPTPSPTASPTPSPTPTPTETTASPTATPTPSPTATGGCSAPANTPGGADGQGGCFPGPDSTGPNAPESTMPTYTGSCTVTAANVVIDSKVVNCSPLTVGSGASGLLIANSYVKGGVISNGSATFTIQDSLIDNAVDYPACSGGTCPAGKYACGDPNNATTQCGVGYRNFTILRTEIINTNRAAYCESTCLIQDNYFHGTNLWPDRSNLAHASSVRNEQYLTLRHNALGCDYTGPFPNGEIGCSADMSGYPDFAPIMHDTIDSNLFLSNNQGTAYCVYGGGTQGKPHSGDANNATYISFTGNVFQRGANGKCGAYGPVTDFISGRTGNVWSGNIWDNGTVVPPA